jgi:hypothetical protein
VITFLRFVLLCLMAGSAFAQSSLPTCRGSDTSRWTNCFGTEASAIGIKYVGEYEDGWYHGQGTYTFANGDKYVGEFKYNDFNGQGTYTLANGNKYVGEWENDKRNGQGIEYASSGSITRQGRWENNRVVQSFAVDTQRFPFNSSLTATAQASNAERVQLAAAAQSQLPPCQSSDLSRWTNCFGTATYAYGNKYVGEWKDGKDNGQGIEYRADGTIIPSGQWASGVLTQSFAIDTNRFPFNAPTQTASATPAPVPDPLKAERDRLASELEASRKNAKDLEERLAAAQATSSPTVRPTLGVPTGRRVALVIGNAQYKFSPLENSVNDATDIDQALKRFGFQTTFLRNASLSQMRESTRRFADQLSNADVALIYFAGHGIESRNKNYMIPVNSDLKFEYELADQAYDAGAWLEMLEMIKSNNAERVNIVILDACRNNNLIGSRSLNRGLGRMDAPAGTFLSYSTAPGKVAADGGKGERNSPFTRNLLKAIQQPGQPIEEVFKEVRRNVTRETNGAQVPWESTSLTGFFSFRQTR